MSRAKMQNVRRREWSEIRDSWLEYIPSFPGIAARPDPGLEHLQPLLDIGTPEGRFPDVPGLRSQTLWEAVFLFHKCAHTNLAAQRLGLQGMHSWCLFNAYHSAYLGARGTMALLGVALPELKGRQVAVELFPEPLKKKKKSGLAPPSREFMIIQLGKLEQRDLWEAFQRVIRMSNATCLEPDLRQGLLDVAHEKISPPRNRFLYRASYWPLGDLAVDVKPPDMTGLFGEELDTEDAGFLLRLSFSVYRLFEQLMSDLASYSGSVKEQLNASRFLTDSESPELSCYKDFLVRVSSTA
jgi:hypothetical protein